MALTPDQSATVYTDLNNAFSRFFVWQGSGSIDNMKIWADRINRDELLVGGVPQYLYPGYTLPPNFDSVPPLPGIPNPVPGVTQPPAPPAVPTPAVSIAISPVNGTLYPGQSLQFTATVSNTTNTAVTWSLTGTSGGATLTSSGLLTESLTNGNQLAVTVTVTSVADPSQSAQATVVLMPPVPTTTTAPPTTTTTPPPTTTTPRPTTTPAPTTTPPPTVPTTTPAPTTTQPPPALPRINSGTAKPKELALPGCDEDEYCCIFPEDPFCGGSGFPIGFPFPFPIGGGGGGPVTIIEGVQESTVWADIWGALTGLWSIIVGAVDAAILSAIKAIQAALSAIAQALSDAFHALARLAGLILKFLETVMSKIIHALARAVQEIARRLGELYDKVFRPILKALNAIRNRLLQIYGKYIRPALVVLQKIRQVLAILKAFHVKWAAKLDAKLADLERRIMQPLTLLLGYINLIANILNLIMTAAYLIQRPIWLNSLNAYKGVSSGLLINAMNPPIDQGALSASIAGAAVPPGTQSQADLHQQLTAGNSSLSTYIGTMNTTFQQQTNQG